MKKILYKIIITITLLWQSYCFAGDDKFKNGLNKINKDDLAFREESADIVVQHYVGNVIKYIVIIATLWLIYWWFLILTAWSEDEKVEKWKNIMKEALIWIVVIFLANPIVKFVIVWILTK